MCVAVGSVEPKGLTDDEIKCEIRDLDRVEGKVRARRLELIAELDARKAYQSDGARSMAGWLMANSGMSASNAHQEKELAEKCREMPQIGNALESGEISFDVATQLGKLADSANVDELVDAAKKWSEADARRHVRRHKEITRAEQQAIDAERKIKTWWNAEQTMLIVNGQLPADQGATLERALERAMGRRRRGADGVFVPYHQMRADALAEIAAASLGSDTDTDRATVVIHVDYEALLTSRGAIECGEGYASAEIAQMAGCDSRIQVVLDSIDGRPVGIGRADRSIPPWLDRLIRTRDKTCIFPGCETTKGTVIHHVMWWMRDSGRTDEINLVLICKPHHRMIHVDGWTLTGNAESGWEITSPDGRRWQVAPRGRLKLGATS